jgi:TM2 domain-containing membrane protein YozV
MINDTQKPVVITITRNVQKILVFGGICVILSFLIGFVVGGNYKEKQIASNIKKALVSLVDGSQH